MVDFTILTSSPTSENLKCFVCKNYLCYFPISFCSNNANVCGRCTIPKGLVSTYNDAYEEICQHFKFPCRFKDEGCIEEFLPKDIPNHEEKCPFRLVKCIIRKPERCQWQGSLPDLLGHCEQQHSDLILQNREFEMDLSDAEERDNLIRSENNLLVFRRKYDPQNKKFRFSLSFSKNETNSGIYSCQLSVTNNDISLTFNFKTDIAKFKEVCLQSLYCYGKPDTFLVKITLPENKSVVTIEHNDINTKMMKFLKCVRCSAISKSSVSYCRRNSALVCSICKRKHAKSCKYCNNLNLRQTIDRAHLQKIFNVVTCPCKYRVIGCTFSSTYGALKQHQLLCEYREVDCPFFHPDVQCLRKEIKKDLCCHILNVHEDFIYTSSDKIEFRPDQGTKMFFMKYAHHLFRLCYSYDKEEEDCMWSLQKIGNFDTKYAFEIEIVDEVSRLRFLVGAQCSDLTGNDNVFEDDICFMNKDQMKCLTKYRDWSLEFKVRIFEV